ncbi:MAG: ABC transporter permease [Clostridiales bacterium]|nr:ABC transporter permease [Clostridiales bacterium]
MFKYITKRILLSVLIIFGVSLLMYALLRMMPGDYVEQKFTLNPNSEISPERITAMKELYGLNDTVIVGYFKWLGKALQGDFGMSFQFDAPVMEVIGDNMWISFLLTLIALLIYYPLGILLGVRAAVKQYSIFDYTTTVITMLGISLPSFFFSAILIKTFAFDLGWFDTSLGLVSSGMLNATPWELFWDKAWHLVLPMVTVVILSIGGLMRYTRTNMLEVLTADYIRTARAKGASEMTVVYKHAFKNTMIPLVTMLAGLLPGLFGGSMIIEQVFAIPGIGLKAYQALNAGDIPFVMGYNMFLAVLTVLGMLLTDIMYAVVDPRVKLK